MRSLAPARFFQCTAGLQNNDLHSESQDWKSFEIKEIKRISKTLWIQNK